MYYATVGDIRILNGYRTHNWPGIYCGYGFTRWTRSSQDKQDMAMKKSQYLNIYSSLIFSIRRRPRASLLVPTERPGAESRPRDRSEKQQRRHVGEHKCQRGGEQARMKKNAIHISNHYTYYYYHHFFALSVNATRREI